LHTRFCHKSAPPQKSRAPFMSTPYWFVKCKLMRGNLPRSSRKQLLTSAINS
jgi:hypothetical protein